MDIRLNHSYRSKKDLSNGLPTRLVLCSDCAPEEGYITSERLGQTEEECDLCGSSPKKQQALAARIGGYDLS